MFFFCFFVGGEDCHHFLDPRMARVCGGWARVGNTRRLDAANPLRARTGCRAGPRNLCRCAAPMPGSAAASCAGAVMWSMRIPSALRLMLGSVMLQRPIARQSWTSKNARISNLRPPGRTRQRGASTCKHTSSASRPPVATVGAFDECDTGTTRMSPRLNAV